MCIYIIIYKQSVTDDVAGIHWVKSKSYAIAGYWWDEDTFGNPNDLHRELMALQISMWKNVEHALGWCWGMYLFFLICFVVIWYCTIWCNRWKLKLQYFEVQWHAAVDAATGFQAMKVTKFLMRPVICKIKQRSYRKQERQWVNVN